MTNEEIWEWMQRDLDGDLSPTEQDALFNLIRKDSDLQLKYNRLKTVSQQLEQLPPVVPSFSIVDSILPRLESAAAVPAASSTLNEEVLPTLEVKRKQTSPSVSKKWKKTNVWLASIGSTAVAACLLIGIMFTGSDGKKIEADPYQQGSEAVNPALKKAPILGPPVQSPPPSTNPSTSNSQEEDKKATQNTGTTKKAPAKNTSSKSHQNNSNKKPVSNPAQTKPVVPPKPVVRDPKPPAFPYGVGEESDKDSRDRDSDSEDREKVKSKDKEKDKDNDRKKDRENDDD
ncbi:hypothetical protein [Brevibacillus centrosporus]|uniref:hypothetical protein n=1 Tax=Brevibacillus centrosporus TaxID=54910 RepID=UPI0037F6EC0C